MSPASSIVLGLLAFIAVVAPCAADDAPTVTRYHGFALDVGRNDAQIDADYASLARQIAIVEAVDAPAAVKTFFTTIPIRVERDLPKLPGQFVSNPHGGFVRILADGMAADRPILLHELLHAYHADVLGQPNATIAAAFAEARDSSDYPANFRKAHFLENGSEYFAVTASIYLFGPIQQPPFDCGVLKKTQPDYLAFLEKQFGPHDCR